MLRMGPRSSATPAAALLPALALLTALTVGAQKDGGGATLRRRRS